MATSLYFDFGIIKKFSLIPSYPNKHILNIGASIMNLNYSKNTLKFNGNNYTSSLPVITRVSTNYIFIPRIHQLIESLNTFEFLFIKLWLDTLIPRGATKIKTPRMNTQVTLHHIFKNK